jgi:hypothetical protein
VLLLPSNGHAKPSSIYSFSTCNEKEGKADNGVMLSLEFRALFIIM